MATEASSPELPLPVNIARGLEEFVSAAKLVFASDLHSIVLYGSAAEGKLRSTSDVNLAIVLEAFSEETVNRLREPLRVAQAAIKLNPMFLLRSELQSAVACFAEKFSDIRRRRRVLHGPDLFASIQIPREVEIRRLRQVVLNLLLRLRSAYALRSLRAEQATLTMAESAGPLRAIASTLLELEGNGVIAPKQALEQVAKQSGLSGVEALLAEMSRAREQGTTQTAPESPHLLFQLIQLTAYLQTRAQALQ